MEYKNAIDILPDELIDEIRKYYPKGMLWIPKSKKVIPERDQLILELMGKKVPINEVAKLADLTPRHIRRLRKKHSNMDVAIDSEPMDGDGHNS